MFEVNDVVRIKRGNGRYGMLWDGSSEEEEIELKGGDEGIIIDILGEEASVQMTTGEYTDEIIFISFSDIKSI